MRDPLYWLSVRTKLALLYVGLCLIAFGVGGYLISGSAKAALESEILNRLEHQCQNYSTALDSYLQMLTSRTEDFASDGYIRDHVERLSKPLSSEETARLERDLLHHLAVNKLPIVPAFENLAVADEQGRVVAIVKPDPDGRNAAAAAEVVGSAGPWYSRLLDPVDGDSSPGLIISTPLYHIHTGAVIGHLLTSIRGSVWVGESLQTASSGISDDEFDVELALRDRHGRELAVPAGFVVSTRDDMSSDIALSGIGLRVRSAASQTGGISYSPVRGTFAKSFPISGCNWTIQVSLRSEQALMPISGLQSRFLGVGLLLAALSTGLLFFPMRFLARPLVLLTRATQTLRKGQLDARVAIESDDEIGDLADAFNHMAESIEERTQSLESTAADLREEQSRTRSERDRLDTVIASMRDGMVVLDAEGEVVISNQAAGALLSMVSKDDAVVTGRHICEDPAKDAYGDCIECLFESAGPSRSCVVDIGNRSFEIHATSLPPDTRGRVGRVLVSRDITDRVTQDEREIHQERLAVLGEVAAVMAHELNNPLASISMFNQMLEAELPEASPLKENVEVIARNTETCKRTIRELLDYATGSAPETSYIELHASLDDVARFLRPLAQRSQVEILLELDGPAPEVVGDEVQLRQVFVNLIMNAIQAIEGGGKVRVSTHTADGYVQVLVADDGPGIPPEARPDIFRPFFTTKPRGAGTGLGLPTSRRITELHGGTLDLVESSEAGTVFRVRLKLREDGTVR